MNPPKAPKRYYEQDYDWYTWRGRFVTPLLGGFAFVIFRLGEWFAGDLSTAWPVIGALGAGLLWFAVVYLGMHSAWQRGWNFGTERTHRIRDERAMDES